MKKYVLLLVVLLLINFMMIKGETYLERLAPVTILYIDQHENNQLFTIALVSPTKEKENVIIESEGTSLLNNISILDSKHKRKVVLGQLRIIMLSSNLAKEGIMDYLMPFYNNADISSRLYVILVEGEVRKFFEENKDSYIDIFLMEMLSSNSDKLNLHYFLKNYYEDYKDPYLYYYKVDGNELVYSGVGLFKGDKLVDTINIEEDNIFKLIMEKNINELPISDINISLKNITSKKKYNFNQNTMSIFIDLDVSICDFNLNSIGSNEGLYKQNIENYLETNIIILLNKLQKNKTDPLGLGHYTKTITGYRVEPTEWSDLWPILNFYVYVNINVNDSGITK